MINVKPLTLTLSGKVKAKLYHVLPLSLPISFDIPLFQEPAEPDPDAPPLVGSLPGSCCVCLSALCC